MNIQEYTDKSIIIVGENSRNYVQQLKDLGGKFNNNLKAIGKFQGGAGWIFPKTKEETLKEFLASVEQSESQDENELPMCVSVTKPESVFQVARWKFYRPQVGMSVSIRSNGKDKIGNVVKVEEHGGIVDTAEVEIEGKVTKLVVINGTWQVLHYKPVHSIKFKK